MANDLYANQLPNPHIVTATIPVSFTSSVSSVNGQTGAVVLDAEDVGADASGSATSALTTAKEYTDAETTARTNAVAQEATLRANADTAETTARTAAIQAEATARADAISAEATARANADTSYAYQSQLRDVDIMTKIGEISELETTVKTNTVAAINEVNTKITTQVQSDWNQTDDTQMDYIKNKPSINNGVLTIKKNGTTIASFGANSSTDVEANILADTQVQTDWSQTDATAVDYIKNKPAINDGTLTIKKNGTTIATFTANSSTDVEANILADSQVQSDFNQEDNTQPDYIKNKPNPITASQGIERTGDNLTLKAEFYDYLDQVTYQKPTISAFAIQNASGASVSGNYEMGSTISVAKFAHTETNVSNISGNLSFKQGSTQVTTTAGSATSATVTLGSAINVTTNTTFYLAGTDTKSNTFSSNKAINFYRYIYATCSTSTSVPTSATKKSDLSTFATSGADFTYAVNDYLWILSTEANKQIQTYVLGQWADVNTTSGGTIQFTQDNGVTVTYYGYRTDKFNAAGTAKYRLK